MHNFFINFPIIIGNEEDKVYLYFDKYDKIFRVNDENSFKKDINGYNSSKYTLIPEAVNNSPDNIDDDYYLRLYDATNQKDGDYLYISDDQYRVSTTSLKSKAEIFRFMSKDNELYDTRNTRRFYIMPKYIENKLNDHLYLSIHYEYDYPKDYLNSYLYVRPYKISEYKADNEISFHLMATVLHKEKGLHPNFLICHSGEML